MAIVESTDGTAISPLATFFALYEPGFLYNPLAPATEEFQRLCEEEGWDEEEDGHWSQAHGAANYRLKEALVQQFNTTYGTDVNSVTSWQALCGAIGVDPIPASLKECQSIILNSHVNLVDLVDAREDGPDLPVTLFPSELQLSEYTLTPPKKIFPKDTAYHTGLLRFLLRHIMNPPKEGSTRSMPKKSKRGRRRR